MAGSDGWEWEEYGQMATAIKICTVWEFLEFFEGPEKGFAKLK